MSLFLACAVGDSGPATPGSLSAQGVVLVQEIDSLAAELDGLALEMEETAMALVLATNNAEREKLREELGQRLLIIEARDLQIQEQIEKLSELVEQGRVSPVHD